MLSNEVIKRSPQLPLATSTALIHLGSIPDSDSIPRWDPDGPKTPSEETQIFYPYLRNRQKLKQPSDYSSSGEVNEFCKNNDLLLPLNKAKHFVNESFSDIKNPKLRLVVDPEDGKERVKIHITIPPASTETFLTNYNNYTRRLVENIPWEKRTMLLFDFSIEE